MKVEGEETCRREERKSKRESVERRDREWEEEKEWREKNRRGNNNNYLCSALSRFIQSKTQKQNKH